MPAFQRDSLDAAGMARLHELQTLPLPDDDSARLKHLTELGTLHRMAGHPHEAIPLLSDAYRLALASGNPGRALAARLRLATAIQYGGDLVTAEAHFRAAVAETATPIDGQPHPYRDFALQHLGKCLVEAGHPEEALPCFEEALRLRQIKGDSELLESTQRALTGVQALLSNP